MYKKISIKVSFLIAIIAVIMTVTFAVSYKIAMVKFNKVVAEVNERQSMYSKLNEIDQTVRNDYIGTIDENLLKNSICQGYVEGLNDPSVKYFTKEKYKDYISKKSGKLIGIGIETIKDSDQNIEVVTVYPGSSGANAGIQKGDIIVAIDNNDVKQIGYSKSLDNLDGQEGSSVNLKVLRKVQTEQDGQVVSNNQFVDITVVRAKYQAETVSSRIVGNSIGYISISSFESNTDSQFNKAVADLKASGAQKFIIDLRNNPGGEMENAVKVMDAILPKGEIVSSIDKQENKKLLYSSSAKELEGQLTVLVNDKTYGVAEVLASAVKDYEKGTVIGQKTYGDGTMKKLISLSDGSAVSIPVGHYVTLKGEIFTNKGITPNKEVLLNDELRLKLDKKTISDNEDTQLQEAINTLG